MLRYRLTSREETSTLVIVEDLVEIPLSLGPPPCQVDIKLGT